MQAPKLKRLNREDFKEADPWFERFVVLFNEFATVVTSALTKNLTVRDNLLSFERSSVFTFLTSSTPVRLKNELSVPPTYVRIDQLNLYNSSSTISSAWSYTWKYRSQGEIEVSFQGLTASTQYELRVTVFG
jgi:hypothetical protein